MQNVKSQQQLVEYFPRSVIGSGFHVTGGRPVIRGNLSRDTEPCCDSLNDAGVNGQQSEPTSTPRRIW